MRTIPRISKNEFGDDVVRASQPCVIVDGLAGWPAMERWSPAYLKSTAAGRRAKVMVSHSGRWRPTAAGTMGDPADEYALPNVPFEEAVDWIVGAGSTGPRFYISQSNIQNFPELIADLRFDRPLTDSQVNLWFGAGGTLTTLHYDTHLHNLFAQIYGTKQFTLFPPSELERLYPYPDASPLAHVSFVDVDSPNVAAYPLFAKAERYTVTVKPGDMLFIPVYWWHHVLSEDLSISVNQWWYPPIEECRGATARRSLLIDYKRDGWAAIRGMRRLSRARLMQTAEALAADEPAIAILAAGVAVEEFERWPVPPGGYKASVDSSLRDRLSRLMASVIDGRDIAASEAAAVIGALKGIDMSVSASASAVA